MGSTRLENREDWAVEVTKKIVDLRLDQKKVWVAFNEYLSKLGDKEIAYSTFNSRLNGHRCSPEQKRKIVRFVNQLHRKKFRR